MTTMQQELLSSLIGLARSIGGNEDLVTQNTLKTVLKAFVAFDDSKEDLEAQIEEVHLEKKKLVPNCFYCESPCGRTSDYPVEEFKNLEPKLKQLKATILSKLMILSRHHVLDSYYDETFFNTFFTALFYLGEDYLEEEELLPILDDLEHL